MVPPGAPLSQARARHRSSRAALNDAARGWVLGARVVLVPPPCAERCVSIDGRCPPYTARVPMQAWTESRVLRTGKQGQGVNERNSIRCVHGQRREGGHYAVGRRGQLGIPRRGKPSTKVLPRQYSTRHRMVRWCAAAPERRSPAPPASAARVRWPARSSVATTGRIPSFPATRLVAKRRAEALRCSSAATFAASVLLVVFAVIAPVDHAQAAHRSPETAHATGASTPPRPPPASLPNQDLITFLKSPMGVMTSSLALLLVAAGSYAFFLSLLRPPSPMHRRRRSGGSGDRSRQRALMAVAAQSRIHADAVAAILAAGCLLLPLVFAISFDDVFAFPKTLLLWALAGSVGVVMLRATMRGARPLASGIGDLSAVAFILFAAGATAFASDPGHALVGERLQYQGLLSMTACVVLFLAARHAFTDAARVRVLSGPVAEFSARLRRSPCRGAAVNLRILARVHRR